MAKKITSSVVVLILFITIIILVIFGFITLRSHWANDHSVTQAISAIDQNALDYVNPNVNFNIPKKVQAQLVQHYFEQYFMPWNTKSIIASVTPAKIFENHQIQKFKQNRGYGQNRHFHTQEWMKNIINNMDMAALSESPQKAISLRDTNVRVLPSKDPSFDNWKKAGEGYPFDYLQNGRLYANTPIAILNYSKDRLWCLVETASYIGWVRSNSIAPVSNTFIQQWKKPTYITLTQNNTSASNANKNLTVLTRMNLLYPLVFVQDKKISSYYKLL